MLTHFFFSSLFHSLAVERATFCTLVRSCLEMETHPHLRTHVDANTNNMQGITCAGSDAEDAAKEKRVFEAESEDEAETRDEGTRTKHAHAAKCATHTCMFE